MNIFNFLKKVSRHRTILFLFLTVIIFLIFSSSPAVAATPPVITPQILPAGQVGTDYAVGLVANPLQIPAIWTITSGALPLGLAISPSTGIISGVPFIPGTFYFYVQVTDNTTLSSAQQLFNIIVEPRPLVIFTDDIPDGSAGVPYNGQISATGGTTPYSWAIVSGNLPTGLILNSDTGSISGIPVLGTWGYYTFTVVVRDSSSPQQFDQASYSIYIEKATYKATVTIDQGLVAGFARLNIDGSQVATLKGGETYTLTIDWGVSKSVTVDNVVNDPTNDGVRYVTATNSQVLSVSQPNIVFGYSTEYKADIIVTPPQLTPPIGSGWYKKDSVINLSANPDLPGDANTEYKFSNWLLPGGSKIPTATLSFTSKCAEYHNS